MPTYKIHPAIGFARVGNSPEFFFGPEKRHEPPNPAGGFKDPLCRVRRQAARFRVFEYPDAPGAPPVEVDLEAIDATLTWKVQLTDAPERTISAFGISPEIRRTPDNVFVGELRMDERGRLIVLGGFGWVGVTNQLSGTDDTTDGYVRAELVIAGTPVPVAAAWVVVAPPKFAPQLDHIVTLWDIAQDRIHGSGPLTSLVSYTEHIYPILKRAQSIQWVNGDAVGHHTWDLANVASLPRQAIFDALKIPGAPPDPTRRMPDLSGLTLTRLQYLRMEAFSANTNFVNDWVGVPTPVAGEPTPDELDRAALEACCGGAFLPGADVNDGVRQAVLFQASDPLRLVPTPPRRLRTGLEKPWPSDYLISCGEYWPIAAPESVLRGPLGAETYQPWFSGTKLTTTPDQIRNWHRQGFVVKDEISGKYIEQQCYTLFDVLRRFRERFVLLRPLERLLRRIITIADPSPIDLGWRGLFSGWRTRGTPAPPMPPDELSRLVRDVDRLDQASLRATLVDLKAQEARVKAATSLVEERLKAPRR
jgi:hypothetical protein